MPRVVSAEKPGCMSGNLFDGTICLLLFAILFFALQLNQTELIFLPHLLLQSKNEALNDRKKTANSLMYRHKHKKIRIRSSLEFSI